MKRMNKKKLIVTSGRLLWPFPDVAALIDALDLDLVEVHFPDGSKSSRALSNRIGKEAK